MYVCVRVYVCIDICVCVCGGVGWVGRYEFMYVCMCASVSTYVCVCARTYVWANMQAYV